MYLAVDIGGTKTLVALFTARGRVVKKVKFKTARGEKRFIHDLTSVLQGFSRRRIRAVVVAIPGVVQKNYSVQFGNRNWPGIDLLTPIKNLFSCPIYFENDANLAALYEGSFYAGKTVFLTFSTGIGGGVVTRQGVLPESDSFEPGHKRYAYKGREAEWEDIAAASALESAFHIDAATDIRGAEALQEVAARIALGIPDIVEAYHPDTIIIGGPMGRIFRRFARYLSDYGPKYARPRKPLESVIYGCYLYAKGREASDDDARVAE